MTRLVLYACPLGELADQLTHYFQESKSRFGANAAHDYMPHITLTGFFPDQPETIPGYLETLERLFSTAPSPVIAIDGMVFKPDFHGLAITSPELRALVAQFIATAPSGERPETIRPKDWLHLSLAYAFPTEQHLGLQQLAEELVNPHANVDWEARFYERHEGTHWICHGCWPLTSVTDSPT